MILGLFRRNPTPPPAPEPPGRVARIRSQDGLSLAVRIFGLPTPKRLPLLCLPGLSRNSRDFIAVGQRLSTSSAEPRQVIAVDLRGRGLSDADRNWRNYNPLVEADDVLAVSTALGIDKAIVLGTSRGGIIAMILGAMRPGLLGGVILNDIGPVIEGTGLARIKTYLGAARPVRSWDEAIEAVRKVAGPSFPALDEADWKAFAEAIFAPGPRGLEPQFDRNLLKTLRAVDFTQSIPVLWPQFDSLRICPVLAIRGEKSDILSPRTLRAMGERHQRLEALVVPGQGHAPLLRDPETLDAIEAFATRCDLVASGELAPA